MLQRKHTADEKGQYYIIKVAVQNTIIRYKLLANGLKWNSASGATLTKCYNFKP